MTFSRGHNGKRKKKRGGLIRRKEKERKPRAGCGGCTVLPEIRRCARTAHVLGAKGKCPLGQGRNTSLSKKGKGEEALFSKALKGSRRAYLLHGKEGKKRGGHVRCRIPSPKKDQLSLQKEKRSSALS